MTGLCFSHVQLASQLRLFDPQLKEKPEEEAFVQPVWLSQLQHLERQVQVCFWLSVMGLTETQGGLCPRGCRASCWT